MRTLSYTKEEVKAFMKMQETLQNELSYWWTLDFSDDVVWFEWEYLARNCYCENTISPEWEETGMVTKYYCRVKFKDDVTI